MADRQSVYVADDDPAIREFLDDLFRSVSLPVRLFESGQELLDQFRPDWTGCIVADLRMPGLSGLEVQARLKARGASLPFIFLTGYGEVEVAVRALKMGATDFLQKPIRGQELLDCVQRALELESQQRAQRKERQETADRLANLNDGERSVLDLMIAGLAYKAIASQLSLSYKTVEARRARIMKKLGAENQSDLYKTMIRYSLAGNDERREPIDAAASVAVAGH